MDIEVIKPNEYIRTEKGHISQNLATIPWIAKDTTINGDLVAKHSKNALDLIEVGDFVNGYKITQIITETNNETKEEKIHLFSGREDTSNKNLIVGHMDSIFEVVTEYEPIKTILTHGQYERNCYRLEE